MAKDIAWLKHDTEDEGQEYHRAAHRLGVPFVALTPNDIAADALLLIPEPVSRAHNIVAYRLDGDRLEVAVTDLDDLSALDTLTKPLHYKVLPRLTDRTSMKRALLHYQKLLKERFGAAIQRSVAAKDPASLAEALLHHALVQGAAAAHLEPRENGLLVRYRIGHLLRDAMTMPAHMAEGLFRYLKSLGRGRGEHERVKVVLGDHVLFVRVAHMPITGGEKLIVHVTHEADGKKGFTLESLGMHGDAVERVHEALSRKHGLITVAGLPNSGVTTLLYTLLDMAAHANVSVATIENAIEYRLPYAAQVEVGEAGIEAAAALRGVLRQDVDVVMIGKISDPEVAALALSAANRGVLVLAGVEAGSAAESIQKLLGLGVAPLTLSATLRAAIGTRMVGKLGEGKSFWRIPRVTSRALETKADFAKVLAVLKEAKALEPHIAWKDVSLYTGPIVGRLALHEVLPKTAAIRELIRSRALAAHIEEQARAEGMLSLTEDGLYKAIQGHTAVGEFFETSPER